MAKIGNRGRSTFDCLQRHRSKIVRRLRSAAACFVPVFKGSYARISFLSISAFCLICRKKLYVFHIVFQITYIGRYGLGSCSSKIPLGCFYGYTYLLPWQLDMAVDCTGDGLQQPANHSLQLANVDIPLSLDNLRQLAEDLRCRYSLACCFLKDLLEQPARLWEVTKEQNFDQLLRDAYKECMQVKLQYNLIQRTVSRLSAPTSSTTSHDSFANAVVRCSSLSMCSTDKLRVMSELVFGCLLRLSSFCKLESTPSFHVPLDLEATVEIFEQFCMKGPVRYACGKVLVFNLYESVIFHFQPSSVVQHLGFATSGCDGMVGKFFRRSFR